VKKSVVAGTCLALATAGPIVAQPDGKPTTTAIVAVQPLDRSILHVQVILDKLGFSPGVLDGKGGESLSDALKGFQEARGLARTGKIDATTLGALARYKAWRPTRVLTISEASLRGPFTNPMPREPEEQTKLDALNYRNPLEALAERFHTTAETLVALNPPGTKLVAGANIVFPNALPTARDYAGSDERWRARLNLLNVSSSQPVAAKIVVDKSERVLRVFDAKNRLVAQFPATMGSRRDPLPIGNWTVRGVAFNPDWQYNPAILKSADKSDPKMRIPPGPNNPVGVVWIDLSKPHYGIHGTPDPDKIGRAESNGCIRLTNWDAARLALMVKAGLPAVFQL
jgi:lipoprotein-anchoring transpeptidase ErfK/SrfK